MDFISSSKAFCHLTFAGPDNASLMVVGSRSSFSGSTINAAPSTEKRLLGVLSLILLRGGVSAGLSSCVWVRFHCGENRPTLPLGSVG